ncbi:MAG: DUF4389 domain-containing protein [Synechococcaceae cyanobacterium]|nr:DUF4389 domain-containing protein [Synechococcaceae cyanobacterium]
MAIYPAPYPARLEIDYPKRLSRLTTLLRPILAIPIAVILFLLNASGDISIQAEKTATTSAGFMSYLALATALMIVFRYRSPRWGFAGARELVRFSARVSAYLLLLTDQYPSTVEEQSVHLEIDYPDVKNELNRWLPLVKWLLAIPHYFVLAVLVFIALFAVVFAWFAILMTGRYPRVLFDFIVGVGRWGLRVQAYAFLLVTDRYPPFSLS